MKEFFKIASAQIPRAFFRSKRNLSFLQNRRGELQIRDALEKRKTFLPSRNLI